jgi:hypothetical protein
MKKDIAPGTTLLHDIFVFPRTHRCTGWSGVLAAIG